MGKVEKLVVLCVMFLIVVILTISLNQKPPGFVESEDSLAALDSGVVEIENRGLATPGERQPSLPSSTPEEVDLTSSPSAPLAAAELPASDWQRVGEEGGDPGGRIAAPGLLDSSVRSASEAALSSVAQQADTRLPAIPLDSSWDLVTTAGLGRTRLDDLLTYECRAGDSFEALALRFYGDEQGAELLRRKNESIESLGEGLQIFVPVRFDMRSHVVQEGESLWKIAEHYYASGSKWRLIYDANRETLRAPEDVKPGMKLKIPR